MEQITTWEEAAERMTWPDVDDLRWNIYCYIEKYLDDHNGIPNPKDYMHMTPDRDYKITQDTSNDKGEYWHISEVIVLNGGYEPNWEWIYDWTGPDW